jgi:hypothetical protein
LERDRTAAGAALDCRLDLGDLRIASRFSARPMKKKSGKDPLKDIIEKALTELLGDKQTKNDEERKELRANLKLAMQFRAIEAKIGDDEYGSGFVNDDEPSQSDDD